MSPALTLYRAASWALAPAAGAFLRARAERGKEDSTRLAERLGRSSAPRPPGPLVWLHGASVGEMQVLRIVHAGLAAERADISFLVTTGTRTSADLAARQPFARGLHQFAPIDAPQIVARFLAHWRPDLAVFAESEIWPNLILGAKAAGARLALVNARLSPESLARWRRMRRSAGRIFAAFDVLLCADERTASGLAALNAKAPRQLDNLKLAAGPAAADDAALAGLRQAIGARPVWLAASTHEGEEEIVLAAHQAIRAAWPEALLLMAPRHPERGAEAARLAGGAPQRSRGDLPGPDDGVYVLDTIGELAAVYGCATVALVAGSLLRPLKGHNPVEPARAGAAILAGPHVESFADLYAALGGLGGFVEVDGAASLARAVLDLWADEPRRLQMTDAATRALDKGEAARTETLARLLALMPEARHARA
jgi:3-deoxy-D-manno-octulosonic-acid transferase